MDFLKRIRSRMNVEPALFFTAMSMSFLLTSQPQFQYWARCIELGKEKGYDDSMCTSSLPENNTFNKEIQKDISETRIYIQIANSLPNIISAPLLGIWADRSGRKLPLIFSICGFCIYALLYIIATLTYRQINVYIWFFISETIWGLSGGACGLIGTMFAMIIDETRKVPNSGTVNVPFRIVLGAILQNIGGFAGNIVITILAGFQSRYLICAILQCVFIFLTLGYIVLFAHETHHPNRIVETVYEAGKASPDSTSNNSKIPSFTWKYFAEICMAIIEVLFRKRRGWVRFCIFASLGLSVVELIVLDINYIYLYIKLPKFAWSDSLFSLFMTLKGLCAAVGMILSPLILLKLRILGKDSVYIIIGCLGGAVSFFMLAFAPNSATVFATAFIYLFVGFLYPGTRSFVPRLVEQNETARIFSIIGVVMVVCPIISGALFNSLYNVSLDWWPGFSFLIAAIFITSAAIGQCLMHYLMYPIWKEEYEAKQKTKMHQSDEMSKF